MSFIDERMGTQETVGGITLFESMRSNHLVTHDYAGLMSAQDKIKLDATYIADGEISIGGNVIVPLTAESDLATEKLTGIISIENLPSILACLQRETEYKVGDLLRDRRLRPGYFLKCVTGGITSPDDITINKVTLNDTVQDGSVVWKICRMAVDEGDAFKTVWNGFTAGTLEAVEDFAEFIQQEDGSIIPAPRRFSTAKIMRMANGDLIATAVAVQADDDSDDDIDPGEGVTLATNEDMDKLAAKFDY